MWRYCVPQRTQSSESYLGSRQQASLEADALISDYLTSKFVRNQFLVFIDAQSLVLS